MRVARRWSLTTGLAVSTLACLARYLVDPLLPKTVEVMLGAIFYLALLSLASSGLLWWSGSLLPSLACALVFFSVYRLLGPA